VLGGKLCQGQLVKKVEDVRLKQKKKKAKGEMEATAKKGSTPKKGAKARQAFILRTKRDEIGLTIRGRSQHYRR